ESLLTQARAGVKLKQGSRFRDEEVTEAASVISGIFRKKGFAYVGINPNIHVNSSDSSARVRFEISPGPRSRFGEVNIQGNEKVSADVIRRRLDFEPGEIYDLSKINKTQKDLYGLSIFSVVSCKVQLDA